MGFFDRFIGSRPPKSGPSNPSESEGNMVAGWKAALDETGPYTDSLKIEAAARGLAERGEEGVLLEYLERHGDDKSARGGRGFLRVANTVYEHLLAHGGLPKTTEWMLLRGPFEYQEMSGPHGLIEQLSEDDALRVYLTTWSSAVRAEACHRLGRIGGAGSLEVLDTVAKMGLKPAFEKVGDGTAQEAAANTWVALGGGGVFKLYAPAPASWVSAFEPKFQKAAASAAASIRSAMNKKRAGDS